MSPIVTITVRALAFVLALGPAAAVASTADRELGEASRRIERDVSPDAFVALASAFMRKARETGDPSYYDRAGDRKSVV